MEYFRSGILYFYKHSLGLWVFHFKSVKSNSLLNFKILLSFLFLFTYLNNDISAQCLSTSGYGSAFAPSSGSVDFTTCNYYGEYSTLNSAVSGTTYSLSINTGGFVTVSTGIGSGAIAWGNSPLSWTAPSSGTFYISWYSNSSCGTDASCHTTTITFISAGVTPINSYPWCESFDGATFAPTNWANTQISGSGLWARSTSGSYPTCSPHSGAGMAYYNSYSFSSGTEAILVTPPLNTSSGTYNVAFWMYRDNGYSSNADLVRVYYNTAPNKTGATLLGTVNRYYASAPAEATANQWYQYTFTLASSGSLYVIFDAVSAYGNNIFVDDVCVQQSCTPPTAVTVSGGGTFCANATLTAANGGSGTIYWQNTTSGGTSTATPSTSQVVSASGTYYFRAYNGSCWGTEGSATVTITPNASITSVTGTTPLCISGTATYSANGVVLGGGTGTWSSSNTSVATVNAAGLVTGVAAGSCNIVYTITGGCGGTPSAQQSVTINPNASITSVTGTTPLCIGGTATYSANGVVLSGGTGAWSSSNTSVATVNASGLVTGVSAGSCNIIYTITGGCGGTPSRQQSVTINPNASITSVTGSTPLCAGGTATYSANGVVLSGGTGSWSSSNTSVATVNAAGLITGIAAGSCNIIYTITGGCGGTPSAQQSVTIVNCAPVATQLVFPAAGPKTYIRISNGTSGSGAYLVVGNPASNAIINGGTTGGWIISESQYNYLAWKQIAATNTFIIPFGYSTTHYLPFTFNKTAGAASDLTASTWGTGSNNVPWAGATNVAAVTNMFDVTTPGVDGSIPYVIDRWWTINAAGSTANLAFSYRGEENTMTSGTSAILGIQHWNGSYWNNGNSGAQASITSTGTAGGSTAGTSYTVALTSTFTEFSPYVLVSLPNPLPVELLSFSANCNDISTDEKDIIVEWKTSSEQYSDYYTIEKSTDGNNFLPVGTVTASGQSNTVKSYSYTDIKVDAPSDILYYRLTQSDFNGLKTTFSPVSVSCSEKSEFNVSVFPNPVKDRNINVSIDGCANEDVEINIYDVIGKIVYSGRINQISNSYLYNIKLEENILPGVYLFNVSVKDKLFSKKLVITY